MAGFRHVASFARSWDEGRASSASVRKVPADASTARRWVDLSRAAGNPKPNYYASSPLVAAVLDGIDGINHGTDKSPQTMHLAEWALATPTAGLVGTYQLLDYCLYYPFVDLDDLDVQTMTNTVTLPRYTDGDGVMAMVVCSNNTIGGGSFTFDYVNQNGDAKTSPTQFCDTTSSPPSSLVTSAPGTVAGVGQFLKLASGDTGIRSVTSWTNLVSNGGLASLVLVKPLASHVISEINTESRLSFVREYPGAPRIVDGAYLGMIMQCAATVAAGTLAGRLAFTWSE